MKKTSLGKRIVCALALSSMISTPALSAQLDISSAPITSTNAAQVKPNIMLLMDTSGSMGWSHMPDEIESRVGIGSIGYKAAECNAIYYNRSLAYAIPKQADGTPFPTPSFTAARYDAFDAGNSTTVNLATSFKAYDDATLRTSGYNDTPQPAYYYYKTGGTTITSYTAAACADGDAGISMPASDGGTWNRVVVGSSEQANFAVWYAYYRTRILLIKSAASLAFTPLTDSFRVGFITVKPKDHPADPAINPDKYLEINDFNTTQRGLWFDKLFSQKPGGSSPTREGLARVGRHYAGKHDGINTGMTGDPVQYSCQQNFTIMTTDGYWNVGDESSGLSGGYIGGPVDITGKSLVGQRDGVLNAYSTNNPSPLPAADVNVTPRPIWDGQFDGVRTIRTKTLHNEYVPCGSYFNKSTTQTTATTSQLLRSTTQTTRSTSQNLQSTHQALQSTIQTLRASSQTTQSTVQNLQSTNQNLRSTTQNLRSTTQPTRSTLQNLQSTNQNLQSTTQNLMTTNQYFVNDTQTLQTVQRPLQSTTQVRASTTQQTRSTSQTQIQTSQTTRSTAQVSRSTAQTTRSTSQTVQNTTQNLRSTNQNLQSTTQNLQSTTQTTQSTAQSLRSTTQTLQSTSQLQTTSSQVRRSTSQLRSCDSTTELCTPVPVGSCTPSGTITCELVTSGPTLVASCTPATASAGNNWTATTCAVSGTGPTPVASCTPQTAAAGNGYTTITCNTSTTTGVAVASCTPQSATSANNYTATTCSNVATGPTPVASCSPQAASAGNSWTTTTCGTNNAGPTGVASCTSQSANAGNNWTTTSCGTSSTSNVPIASCTAASANAGNSWTTTTCSTNNTSNIPVQTCTTSAATAANNWTTTTCSTSSTSNVPVATCTASAASAGNSWTATTCSTNNTSNVPTGTCVASSASAGNSWTTTTCGTVNTGPTGVSSCTPSAGNAGNSWTTTTCGSSNTGPTPVSTCSASAASAGNSWTTTTCSNNNSGPTPVASCTAAAASAGNSWTTTTCNTNTTGPTPIASCTPIAASAGNAWTATTCPVATTGPTGVSSCSPSSANAGNSWTTTTCNTVNAGPTPVASCTTTAASAGNGWTATTCSNNNTTNVPVASCTPSAATAGNNWTTTTCPAPQILSGPTPVGSCTASPATAGNGYQQTTCTTSAGSTPVQPGTCVPQSPNAGNNYTTRTCTNTLIGPTPVASCTPQTAAAGNNWLQITCSTNNTSNVPVVACTASAATAANNWTTTTCPAPVTSGPTPVASCTAQTPTGGNSYTSTTCSTATTGPTAVSSCSPIAASAGNSWTATTCASNDNLNVPVASCSPSGASAGNSWTTTTCSNNNTTNVPVFSCAGSAATAANNWTTTTCSAATTTNVPVASCSASGATAANNWVATTCSNNNTTNVPTGSCTASAASAGNNWTTTTCPVLTTGPTGVSTCAAQTGNAGNSWLTVTCTPSNTSNVPVATCTASAASAGNSWTATTCSYNDTTDVPVSSCSGGAASAGNNWTTTTCRTATTTNVPVSSCTASAASAGNNWTATTCPVIASGNVGAPSCTPSGPNAGNGWTTTTCPGTVTTGPTPVASCTTAAAAASNSWTNTSCNVVATGPTVVTSCTAEAADAGNAYTATTCASVGGSQLSTTTLTRVQTFNVSGGVQASTGTDVTTSSGAVLSGACYAPGTQPPLPADSVATWTPADQSAYPSCTGWPCTVDNNTGNPRSINSLADVAQYYYITDLRTAANEPRGPDYYKDDVPAVGSGAEDDRVRWQHMTTFSIALGVSGTLNYRTDYKSAASGDFADIRSGAKDWPLWPDPSLNYAADGNLYNDLRSIDDFWHAAVNGRGTFFSAADPTSVIAGLAGALAGITARVASSTGAGTSSQQPVTGDNFAYLASYTTQYWSGDVQGHEINVTTGDIETPVLWSAQAKLDASVGGACDNRTIKLFRSGATNNLVNFSWNTKACDTSGNPTGSADTGLNATEQAWFTGTAVTLLSQYPSMTDGTSGTPNQRSDAAGANLVNFLRGQRGLEDFTSGVAAKLYRKRDHVLGDVVDGQPTYVRRPFANYAEHDYAGFKTAQAGRTPMIYVAANDGMLHALYAGTSATDPQGGKEAWSFMPTTVLPRLFKLADANYKNIHEFFVDGTPSISDVWNGSEWRTILVAGLNAGGRGYYALDVTDPATPKAMWEFKRSASCYAAATPSTHYGDCHLGLTFGKPIISKLADGRWVAMVTSGYNNVNASPITGDGGGYLYVLDVLTGEILYKIATNVGDATTPSGLAQINNFVEKADVDNTTLRVYGTDVLGNVWRFDVNDTLAPSGREATLVGTAKDNSGTAQPITIRAELTKVGDKPMLFVATGKLLGATDVSDTQMQSIYGIVDPLTPSTAYSDLRGSLAPLGMTQTGTGSSAQRTIACTGTTAQCGVTSGWRVDLPDVGERVNVEMKLRDRTLVIGSNVPQISACTAGGYSWLNYLDYKSGLSVGSAPNTAVSVQLANSLIVGLTVIKLADGTIKAVVTTSDGGVVSKPVPKNSDVSSVKRISWREVPAQ